DGTQVPQPGDADTGHAALLTLGRIREQRARGPQRQTAAGSHESGGWPSERRAPPRLIEKEVDDLVVTRFMPEKPRAVDEAGPRALEHRLHRFGQIRVLEHAHVTLRRWTAGQRISEEALDEVTHFDRPEAPHVRFHFLEGAAIVPRRVGDGLA